MVGARTRLPLALVGLVGLLIGASSCAEPLSADEYFIARDNRVVEYCRCFGPLIGYRNDDGEYGELERDQCIAGEQFEHHQEACIAAILDEDDAFQPDTAFACLQAAEVAYTSCLSALACEDIAGLDACIVEYNDARDNCPRLSTNDEETFDKCLRV